MSRLPHEAEIPSIIPGHYTDSLDLHSSNLFDLDETTYGDYLDPATGKPIDNSTFRDIRRRGIFNESGQQVGYTFVPDNMLLTKEKSLDAADLWLIENDPAYKAHLHR